ncbi:MAG TPA: plasmid maintenance protein CcdB [Geobacter sp.]|nr:plasmid maintenance protein CcdB [Geobacter sp.]
MAQFDVYRNPSPTSSGRAPYFVEVQGNYCAVKSTCVIIPLVISTAFFPAPVLNPLILLDGVEYILSTAEITAVARSRLGRRIGSIQRYHNEILRAIDRLLE